MRFSKENFQRRVTRFSTEHAAEQSPESFFEQHVAVDVLSLDKQDDIETMMEYMTGYIEQGGKPCNFHPSIEEVEALEQQKAMEEATKAEAERIAKEDAERCAAAEAKRKAEEIENRQKDLARKEEEILAAKSKPLVDYMSETVMPIVTEGLAELAKLRPEDPFEYLAEFLMKRAKE
eukprot:TRINITY_DN1755_c0_g1_i3.p1 TRINITY_DN1755_c0_g1~~TRINITY_DN1755_c0_g1_i3.p1  ORF type:complete len:177 (-),score=76.70 TRINITY_DN1755_c0_g1_i3:163-693(-)